jgi:hypothetical protein
MSDVVICEPIRTPVGRYGGAFASLSAVDLAAGLVIAPAEHHPPDASTFLRCHHWFYAAAMMRQGCCASGTVAGEGPGPRCQRPVAADNQVGPQVALRMVVRDLVQGEAPRAVGRRGRARRSEPLLGTLRTCGDSTGADGVGRSVTGAQHAHGRRPRTDTLRSHPNPPGTHRDSHGPQLWNGLSRGR